jgi:hypothetical protein
MTGSLKTKRDTGFGFIAVEGFDDVFFTTLNATASTTVCR